MDMDREEKPPEREELEREIGGELAPAELERLVRRWQALREAFRDIRFLVEPGLEPLIAVAAEKL